MSSDAASGEPAGSAPDVPAVGLAAALNPASDESAGSPDSIWNLDGDLLPIADPEDEHDRVPTEDAPAEGPEHPEHDRGPLVLVLTLVGVLLFALGLLAIFSRDPDPTEIVAGAGEERDPTTTTSTDDGSTGTGTWGGDSGSSSTSGHSEAEDSADGGAGGSAGSTGSAPPAAPVTPPAESGTETSSTQVTRPPGDTPPAPAPTPSPGVPPVTTADIPGGFAELIVAIADLDVLLGERFVGAPLYDSIQVFDQFAQPDGSTAPIGADVRAAVATLQTPVAVGFVSSEPAPGTPAIWVKVSQPVASGNTFQFGVELRCPLCGGDAVTTVVPVVREADGCWHLAAPWHAALYGAAPMC
ncbi:MAG: hypothetical protein EDR02_10535 [Actinobacteria bacterium]|nr:MAG: hypothetical protein EDR02_10535 [Actinomycetota bacterium]